MRSISVHSDRNTSLLQRHADGRLFEIVVQARSPSGPVTLRSVDEPTETVETTNDRIAVDFDDLRRAFTAATVPTPKQLRAQRVTDLAPRIAQLTAEVTEQLRTSPELTATVRAENEVIDAVARTFLASGWKCDVQRGDARDMDKTSTLRVYPPCTNCDGRGVVKDGYSDGASSCSDCKGKGYVA